MAKHCIHCGHVNEDSAVQCVCGGDLDKATTVAAGAAPGAMKASEVGTTEGERKALIAGLNRLALACNVVVGLALVLLVLSLILRGGLSPDGRMALAVLRSLAWAAAGVLSLVRAAKSKEAGLSASYGSAVTYLVVAVVPLLKGF